MKGSYSNDFNADFVTTSEGLKRDLRKDIGRIKEQNQIDLAGTLAKYLNKLISCF